MFTYVANIDQHRMRKIRSTISSVPGMLEKIRRNPSNTELGKRSYDVIIIISNYIHTVLQFLYSILILHNI